jgi:aspartate 1-decarboxylase
MLVHGLKSKIHRATITDCHVEYPGSIGVDTKLLEAAGIMPYEKVLVADVDNGARLETYVVPEEAGSGKVVILGAAARLMNPGDIVILLNFALFEPEELKTYKPKVIVPDEKNQI